MWQVRKIESFEVFDLDPVVGDAMVVDPRTGLPRQFTTWVEAWNAMLKLNNPEEGYE